MASLDLSLLPPDVLAMIIPLATVTDGQKSHSNAIVSAVALQCRAVSHSWRAAIDDPAVLDSLHAVLCKTTQPPPCHTLWETTQPLRVLPVNAARENRGGGSVPASGVSGGMDGNALCTALMKTRLASQTIVAEIWAMKTKSAATGAATNASARQRPHFALTAAAGSATLAAATE